jgi:hypothetical protein
VRSRLGIGPDTEVEFELVGDEARLRVVGGTKGRGRDIVAAMRGKASSGLTTSDIMRLTRGKR